MTSHILQAVWPIIDDGYTRSELIAEATAQLEEVAEQAHGIVTGPPLWFITPAEEVPGWGAYAPGLVLIAMTPAEPFGSLAEHRRDSAPDPAAVERLIAGNPPAKVRQVDKRAAILQMVRSADVEAVASRLGMTVRAVEKAIDRDRVRTLRAANEPVAA